MHPQPYNHYNPLTPYAITSQHKLLPHLHLLYPHPYLTTPLYPYTSTPLTLPLPPTPSPSLHTTTQPIYHISLPNIPNTPQYLLHHYTPYTPLTPPTPINPLNPYTAPQTCLGFDASGDRQRVDRWQGYIVVPSPGDTITSKTAVVKAWNVYTSAAGEINFMVSVYVLNSPRNNILRFNKKLNKKYFVIRGTFKF